MNQLKYSTGGKVYTKWSELIDYFRDSQSGRGWSNWLFRGHQCSKWELKSSLERAVVDRARAIPNRMAVFENGLLRRFKRQAHHYISAVPADDAWMEWQALMQHYGAPTRLLDWTYSFYVAAFFAVENVEPGERCAIWALDSAWCYRRAFSVLPQPARDLIEGDPNTKQPETVSAILNKSLDLVFPINPERLNERLVIQQGAFLVPGNVSRTFMDNLSALAGEEDTTKCLIKLHLEFDVHELEAAIRDLNSMNVNRATLFPGLDGFSSQLKNLVFLPEQVATDEERLRGPG